MINLYYARTPNGYKIKIFLEESGMKYDENLVDLSKGEQFKPEFLKISPNNKIPAILDTEPKDNATPISVFESGAILMYLAEKAGKFIPSSLRKRVEVIEWLFWQVGGLGPMAGQAGHFRVYAKEKVPYGIERYTNESKRLYGVLEKRLEGREDSVEDVERGYPLEGTAMLWGAVAVAFFGGTDCDGCVDEFVASPCMFPAMPTTLPEDEFWLEELLELGFPETFAGEIGPMTWTSRVAFEEEGSSPIAPSEM